MNEDNNKNIFDVVWFEQELFSTVRGVVPVFKSTHSVMLQRGLITVFTSTASTNEKNSPSTN